MLIIPTETRLLESWLSFKINDVDLLIAGPVPIHRTGLFIASINSPVEFKEFLFSAGCYLSMGARGIAFRTSNPRVAEMAMRFHTKAKESPGHNFRFVIRDREFDQLAIRYCRKCLSRLQLN